MLAEFKLRSLKEILQETSKDELVWIGGYIAALTAVRSSKIEAAETTEKIYDDPVGTTISLNASNYKKETCHIEAGTEEPIIYEI